MDWKSKVIIRILLLVAKILATGPLQQDIQSLANHISVGELP